MNPQLPDRQNLAALGAEDFYDANAAERAEVDAVMDWILLTRWG